MCIKRSRSCQSSYFHNIIWQLSAGRLNYICWLPSVEIDNCDCRARSRQQFICKKAFNSNSLTEALYSHSQKKDVTNVYPKAKHLDRKLKTCCLQCRCCCFCLSCCLISFLTNMLKYMFAFSHTHLVLWSEHVCARWMNVTVAVICYTMFTFFVPGFFLWWVVRRRQSGRKEAIPCLAVLPDLSSYIEKKEGNSRKNQ